MKIPFLIIILSILVFSNEATILDDCEKGNSKSCREVGDIFKYDLGELYLSIKYYDLGCKYGDAISCKNSGSGFLFLGSKEKGLSDFKKSCELNHYPSCALLGSLYLQGEIVKPNIKYGYLYLLKACNKGKMDDACNVVAAIEKDLLRSKKSKK